MSEASLIVRFGDLERIETALTLAHDDIVDQVQTMRTDVRAMLAGWEPDTASRRAQLAYDERLGRGVETLTAALEKVRVALAGVREDAHAAEVRNVAIMD